MDRKSIRDLIVGGLVSVAEIAAAHRVSASTVRRMKAAITKDNDRRLAESANPPTSNG